MGVYSAAVRTSGFAITSPAVEIVANAVVSPRLLELCITTNVAVAATQVYGLGRPAAVGVGPQNAVTVQPHNINDPAGQTQLALFWTTPPTAPTVFTRRATIGTVVATGIIWSFPRGVIIAINKTLVVWNITANTIPPSISVTVVE